MLPQEERVPLVRGEPGPECLVPVRQALVLVQVAADLRGRRGERRGSFHAERGLGRGGRRRGEGSDGGERGGS